jgi:hypothetical protein
MLPKQQNLTIDYYYLERFFISTYLRNIVFIVIIIIILSFALLASILALLPVAAQEQIKLEALSEQGTFRVEIFWISNHIGSPNTFEIHFVDPATGSEIEDIKYDISIYRNNSTQEFRRLDQVSTVQQISFEEQGSYEIRIDDIDDLGEGVTIPIKVAPEFQHEVLIFAAAAVGLALVASLKPINKDLFRQPIN